MGADSVFETHCGKGVEVEIETGAFVTMSPLNTRDYSVLMSISREMAKSNKQHNKSEEDINFDFLDEVFLQKLFGLIAKSIRTSYPITLHPTVTDDKIDSLSVKYFGVLSVGLLEACGMVASKNAQVQTIS